MNYQTITEQLQAEGELESASQLQGRVCGLLCAGGQLPSDSTITTSHVFTSVQQALAQQFEEEALTFGLLLPEDEAPMEERLMALGHWCQGVLSGFGEANLDPALLTQKDTAELIRDIESISQVSPELKGSENDFENEQDYVEVVEYLRIAIANLYADLILIPAQE